MKAIIAIMLFALCSFSYAANTIAGGSTPISADEIKANADYSSFADFGAQAVVAQALEEKKLSSDKDAYRVLTINSLSKQVLRGTNYKYDVQIVNSDGSIVINTQFVVYYRPSTKAKSVTVISYSVVNSKNTSSGIKKIKGTKNY